MAEYDGSIRIGTGIDIQGFDDDGKKLEAKARRLAENISGNSDVEIKVDSTTAKKELKEAFDDIEKEEKRIEELAKRAVERARGSQTATYVPEEPRYGAPISTPGYNQDAIKAIEEQTEKVDKIDEHWNQLRIDVEEYAKSLKELQSQGKFFGDEDYDQLYLYWKNATDAVKAYQAELNKQTDSGQTKIAEQEAKAAEKREAAQRRAEEQAERALQKENARIQKEIENQAKLEAKEEEKKAKEEAKRAKEVAAIQAQEQEEQRLDQIRVNAVASNDQIIAKVERLKQLEQEITDLKKAGITAGYSDYDSRIKEASQLKKDIQEYEISLSEVPEKFSRMREAAQKTFNAVRSGLSTIGKIGKKAFSSLASLAKKAFGTITNGTKKSSGLLSTFASRFKGLALSLLIFNQISKAFNAMISGMKKGFENFTGYSDSYAQSIQNMKNAMSTLGNQFAAAFAPIVQMVIPWLNSLINALSSTMTYVAQFIAALTGKSTFTKATQIQDKYNKSLGGTAKAADKARGALAKFDDLDVLEKKDDSSGGGGGQTTDPSNMFEEVELESKWENISEWFREMWENFDFHELGNLLGAKLKEALDSIDWGQIKEAAAGIAKSIGTLINGFVEADNLGASIGQTIGNAINAGLAGINSFLDSTHWDSVGQFIGNGLNGIVNTVDWDEIGHFLAAKFNAVFETIKNAVGTFDWVNLGVSLSNGLVTFIEDLDTSHIGGSISEIVKGLLDTVVGFIENTDWKELGNTVATKIGDFISSIDWNGIADRLFEGLGASIAGLGLFLWGLIEDAWSSVVSWWNEVAFEDGQFTMSGLLNGIWEGIKNIGQWIYDHIFKPFVDGFKKAFGIHSPSTVMAEMGNFLMEGLFNGVSELVNKVVSVFNKLKNKIVNVWNIVREKTAEIWDGIVDTIKKPINAILGFVETLANGVIDAMNFMIQALNHLSFDVPDWIHGIGGKTFGFNLTELNEVSIPRLATGAVIRGGNPFMAILGDQPAGKTNIEAPLATIEQAVENVMSRNKYGRESVPVNINLQYDGETFARLSISDILSELGRQGYNIDVLGVT